MSKNICFKCWGEGSLLEERADCSMMILECDSCNGTGETN